MTGAITFGSACSGIEAATVAWAPLGWESAWFAEIAPFPAAVLAHHHPDVPNLGDMTLIAPRVLAGVVAAPDVLVGGTPCQAFSVAGLRESLADGRGNLTLKFVELANAIDHVRVARGEEEAIVVWENVPGVLSTKDNAFGCFLAGLAGEDEPLVPAGKKWSNAGCVYGPKRAIAWRTLDAQYFGLAQRRRRVFVVASARNGFDPAAVLFEWEGVRRDTPPSQAAGQGAAASLAASAGHHGYSSPRGDGSDNLIAPTLTAGMKGDREGVEGHLVTGTLAGGGRKDGGYSYDDVPLVAFGGNNTSGPIDVATALTAHGGTGRHDFESETFLAFDTTQISSPANFSAPQQGDPCHPLSASGHAPAIAFDCKASGMAGFGVGNVSSTMRAMGHADSHQNGGGHLATMASGGVRRLTPRECERLQGFPDDYTLIPYGKAIRPEKLEADWIKYLMRGGRMTRDECQRAAADGPRYKALGNSMATTVMAWIGRRIQRAMRAAA